MRCDLGVPDMLAHAVWPRGQCVRILKGLLPAVAASLRRWEEAGVRAVWVQVALQHASLVPVCAEVRSVKSRVTDH